MAAQETDTTAAQVGTENQDNAVAAEANNGTATETTEAGEQLTDEQKAEQAEAAKKAEEVKKAKDHTDPGVQKKIDREVRRRKEAEEAREQEREGRHKAELEAAELKGRLAGSHPGKQAENAPPAEPNPEDFETVADFNKAMLKFTRESIDFRTKQMQADNDKKFEEIKRSAIQPAETPQQRTQRERAEKLRAAVDKASEEFGEEVRETVYKDKNFPLSGVMIDTILDKESGAKILGTLVDNRDIALKIARLPLPQQVREIDKLEQAITAKKETAALPPLSTVSGKGAPGQVDESKMSEEEWARWKRKQKLLNSA